MINPGQRVRLEDELIRFFRETHDASSAQGGETRWITIKAYHQSGMTLDAEINISALADAILDGRVRLNG